MTGAFRTADRSGRVPSADSTDQRRFGLACPPGPPTVTESPVPRIRRRLVAAAGLLPLGGCSWGGALAAATPGAAREHAGLAYGDDPRQRLDVYQPDGDAPPAGRPVAVFFYGGSWNRGSRTSYRFVGRALASRGIVTVVPDYRVYPQVRYPDFLPIENRGVRPVFHHPDYPPHSQPIGFAARLPMPVFLGAAATDSLVDPQRNTVQLARRLREAGTLVTERLYEGANHVTLLAALAGPLRWIAPVLDDLAGFVARPPVRG